MVRGEADHLTAARGRIEYAKLFALQLVMLRTCREKRRGEVGGALRGQHCERAFSLLTHYGSL